MRSWPLCIAALLLGSACGSPDEVRRASVNGGQTAGSSGAGAGGSSKSLPGGGSSAAGGAGGSVAGSPSSSKSNNAGAAGSNAGAPGGSSSTYPSVGGSSGGTSKSSAGGGSSASTSTDTPPAADSLAAYIPKKPEGGTAQMKFDFQIANLASKPVDLSSVTLRYWYQDEGLGAAPTVEIYYISIGKVSGTVAASSPPAPGADHYLELSFTTGSLAAKGAMSDADKVTVSGGLHTPNYQGAAVVVDNDYSYNAGSVGYNKKMTIHAKDGSLIAGTPPGADSNPGLPSDAGATGNDAGAADAGVVDANVGD